MDALPERRLIGAIIDVAISDAKIDNGAGVIAAEFLLGPRIDAYLHLLDIEATEFKRGLVRYANENPQLDAEARPRRLLRNNLEEVMKIYGYVY